MAGGRNLCDRNVSTSRVATLGNTVTNSSGITFTDQEKQFVVRAEKTETPEEVIQLAKDILKFSKEQKQEEKQEKLEDMTVGEIMSRQAIKWGDKNEDQKLFAVGK